MDFRKSLPLLALAASTLGGISVRAQDSVPARAEPVDLSIDPARLSYDYLVDGSLPRDDPAARKYRTLQAAYAAAPAGTVSRPTVIGIAPNVYFLPGRAPRGPSLAIRKNYMTLLGLTNDRRTVVLADNRGLMQGADDDGYILDVNAVGFTARNLTIINYCNADYQYPGDPSRNLVRRSDVITQGVALQASGDKHVYDNVALLGRLDTMFLRTKRSYFHNVYIEGTDDWMGGGQISLWEDCTLVFPTGRGVMSASDIVFRRCRFVAAREMQFYKAEYHAADRPDVLIDCILPAGRVAWIRGIAAPRPSQPTRTYRLRDPSGRPVAVRDSTVGPPGFAYSSELTDREVRAFNPWNLLRAPVDGPVDDWDPAGVSSRYADEGSLPFRVLLTGGSPRLRTGGSGGALAAVIEPRRAAAAGVTWSSGSNLVALNGPSGREVSVSASNGTESAAWVAVRAKAGDGIYATAYVYAEPHYTAPPDFTRRPRLEPPAAGRVAVDYALGLAGRQDQSLVSWYLCNDAAGNGRREIAVSRGDQPLRELVLSPGCVGKFIEVSVEPKHGLSDPGPAAVAVSERPVAAADVPSRAVSPDFRNFVTDPNPAYESGLWTVLGTWAVVSGDWVPGGYGVRPSTPAYLFYQQDAPCVDMRVDLVMTPEKTEGTGFSVPGSPADEGARNLHSDVYIKFDARTRTGYALRFWRTTRSAAKCMFQFYRIENGVGTPLDGRQVLSGAFKPTTRMTLEAVGTRLTATATNDVDGETLHLEGTFVPNPFGGAGVYWPRGSSNVYSQITISYPR